MKASVCAEAGEIGFYGKTRIILSIEEALLD